MSRILWSIFISAILAATPIAAYWLAGFDFVRCERLSDSFVISVLIFIGAVVAVYAYPGWDKE